MAFHNRFGLFIHWGIYAQTGLHEQAFARYDLPSEEYERNRERFNPVRYDPDQWVRLAKEAGMQYVCFTAKHHDGFCMWDTKYTDYSIMHTPYGRDVLRMLADACRRQGMKLSLYYSNPDWHDEYGYNPASSHQWKARRDREPDTERLREYIVRQMTELLTNYGPIYTLFWDIPPRIRDERINKLARQLQPGILINDRGFDEGDFSTPEREYQAIGSACRFSHPTEACNSLGEQSWGYRRDEDFYSARHLLSAIDRYMAMGASYLLNVGPNELGEITEPYAGRLRRIGDWYNRMQGCLEDHEADPFDYGPQKNACIAVRKDGKTYLHYYNGLISDAVALERVPRLPRSVTLMNTGRPLRFGMERLPGSFDGETGVAREFLRISGIPVDDLASEPIVLRIDWGD